MVEPQFVLTILQIVIAAATVAAVGWSLYNGTVGELKAHMERIPMIESKVDQIEDKQEDMADAVIVLTRAQERGFKPDSEAVARDLLDGEGLSRYVRDGDVYQPRAEDEEEEMGSNSQMEYPLGEVDEP